jgi:hypothetical protein
MRAVAERLRSGEPAFDRTRAYDGSSANAATEVLGLMLVPSELHPRGPELEIYRAHAARFRTACAALFDAQGDFEARVSGALSVLGGGARVEVARFDDGHPYTPATIRVMPEGCGAPRHRDHCPDTPCYAQLREAFDLGCQYSYYVPITLPEAGGELRIAHGSGELSSLTPGAGDLIVFAGNRFEHEVLPAVGKEPRRTIGGFAAFERGAMDALGFWS